MMEAPHSKVVGPPVVLAVPKVLGPLDLPQRNPTGLVKHPMEMALDRRVGGLPQLPVVPTNGVVRLLVRHGLVGRPQTRFGTGHKVVILGPVTALGLPPLAAVVAPCLISLGAPPLRTRCGVPRQPASHGGLVVQTRRQAARHGAVSAEVQRQGRRLGTPTQQVVNLGRLTLGKAGVATLEELCLSDVRAHRKGESPAVPQELTQHANHASSHSGDLGKTCWRDVRSGFSSAQG